MIFRDSGDHMGVKALWLGTVAVVEHALTVTLLYIRFTAGAGNEEAQQ
ncbi:MAG: hypothetical protein Cons2KO_11930 [Congregibacter sp.]